MFDDEPQVSMELARSPDAARQARAALRALVGGGGATAPADELGDVLLATSELVTNALVHTPGPVSVRAWLEHRVAWRVEVEDCSSDPPVLRHPGSGSEGGRGMHVVQGITSRWGCDPVPNGKRLWFEIVR